nr:hypothetical protein [Tanacetum cinerariifolium]
TARKLAFKGSYGEIQGASRAARMKTINTAAPITAPLLARNFFTNGERVRGFNGSLWGTAGLTAIEVIRPSSDVD